MLEIIQQDVNGKTTCITKSILEVKRQLGVEVNILQRVMEQKLIYSDMCYNKG